MNEILPERYYDQLFIDIENLFHRFKEEHKCNPMYLFMDIKTYLEFETAMQKRLNIAPTIQDPKQVQKKLYRSCELIMMFSNTKERRIILA